MIRRGLHDSSPSRGRTSRTVLCGSWGVSSETGMLSEGSRRNRSSRLGACQFGRRSCVCDMGMWASSEIVIRNQSNGCRSRGRCGAFDEDQRQSTCRSKGVFGARSGVVMKASSDVCRRSGMNWERWSSVGWGFGAVWSSLVRGRSILTLTFSVLARMQFSRSRAGSENESP